MKAFAMAQVADRRLEHIELEVPLVRPEEGLLRVEACGLCGSDLEQYHGLLAKNKIIEYPIIPGHEPVGILEEVGSEAAALWGLRKGDRVAIAGPLNCGRCFHCLGGSHHLCRSVFNAQKFIPAYGLIPTTYGHGLWGGYSQYIHLHPRTLFCKIPDNVPSRMATMYQALAAGLRWAVAVPKTAAGDSVLVLGCGQRGLACVVALKRAGVRSIIVTGLARDRFKLDLARQLGATATIVVDEEPVVETVMKLTNGRGVDVAVDVVPVAGEPILHAIEAIRTGGTIVLAGIKGGDDRLPINTDQIVTREITVKGVMTQPYEFYANAVELLGQDLAELAPMHTHEFPLADIEQALRVLGGEESGESAISISVHPEH
jgi:threonine dehydrogenase-like Zn-dependent dehydrogenase